MSQNNFLSKVIQKPKENILVRKNFDGSLSVLCLENDQHYYTIEGLAVEVWNSINGKSTGHQLAERVMKKHKNLPSRFYSDVQKFLKSLSKENLIE